jgi:hypothetical protein
MKVRAVRGKQVNYKEEKTWMTGEKARLLSFISFCYTPLIMYTLVDLKTPFPMPEAAHNDDSVDNETTEADEK